MKNTITQFQLKKRGKIEKHIINNETYIRYLKNLFHP